MGARECLGYRYHEVSSSAAYAVKINIGTIVAAGPGHGLFTGQ